jgi:hypothetical protein
MEESGQASGDDKAFIFLYLWIEPDSQLLAGSKAFGRLIAV